MGFGLSWASNALTSLNAGDKVFDGGQDSLDLSSLKLKNVKAAFDEVSNVLKDVSEPAAVPDVSAAVTAALADVASQFSDVPAGSPVIPCGTGG